MNQPIRASDPGPEPDRDARTAGPSSPGSGGAGEPSGALLAAVAAGEAEAVDAWFRAEHPTVWRLCLGFTGQAALAEDLAQDALLKLYDAMPGYDPERPYRPWRNTIVLNVARAAQRRAERRAEHEATAAAKARPGVLPDPAQVAEQAEVRAVLAATLASLSAREREAFVLRDLEGDSTEEVAATLGITASSVRSLLTLARRRLRGLLGPGLDPATVEDARGRA